ncbi:MAG: ribosomal protein S18-alanine N-acetyltransferase, partial [Myxococcota bacterium]
PIPWPAKLFLAEIDRDWAHLDVVRPRAGGGIRPIIAFCNYWLVRDEVHLLNLATHPEWRRRGVARALMDRLMAFSDHHRCCLVTLEVRRSNEPAQALYRDYGFAAMGIRPRYYAGDGEDAVVMTLDLDGPGDLAES